MNARVAVERARRSASDELGWQRLLWASARGIAEVLDQPGGSLDPEEASRLQLDLETLIGQGDEARGP